MKVAGVMVLLHHLKPVISANLDTISHLSVETADEKCGEK